MSSKTFRMKTTSYDRDTQMVEFRGLPDECPACHRGQDLSDIFEMRPALNNDYFGFFQCRYDDCRVVFVGRYEFSRYFSIHVFVGTQLPSYTRPIDDISERIDVISPEFRKIYTQAHCAEESGLDLIAGCGYRKALEFLIKDYCISLTLGSKKITEASEEEKELVETIKKSQLSFVIKNYLDMPKVVSAASRAVWLGNDETHYEKKIENGGVEAMKSLMRLTIHNIEADEELRKYEASILPVK